MLCLLLQLCINKYLQTCHAACSPCHTRNPLLQVLATLGASLQFEVAVGLNGGVWVSAPTPGVAVLVAHALRESRHVSDAQCKLMVEGLLKRVAGGR